MNTVGHLGSGNSARESPIANSRDELKTQFITREGVYKQMTLSEYSRPNRVSYNQGSVNVGTVPVRVSFLTISPTTSGNHDLVDNAVVINGDIPQFRSLADPSERKALLPINPVSHSDTDALAPNSLMCFNIGRELYVYVYRGVNKAVDLNKPVDKRVYKGTFPTCHDFNQITATSSSCSLVIGFSAGQMQLIDPFQKDFQASRLFNEDRFIDKTPVTCLRWVPGQPQCFLASHASGNMYLYNEELPCMPGPPLYQVYKQGEGYTVHTCKSKTPRNPVYRFAIGNGPINQFAFSQNDAKYLATVGHDGYLRVFNFQTMELTGFMKSYFGGLLCLSWSPDSKYIVTGGEDDLITVYSVFEKKIVCRGQGHKSWVSQVAFDPFTSHSDGQHHHFPIDLGSDDDLRPSSFDSNEILQKGNTVCAHVGNRFSWNNANQFNGLSSFGNSHTFTPGAQTSFAKDGELRSSGMGSMFSRTQKESISSTSLGGTCLPTIRASYRIGSVGQDTQLCLWDLTDDVLRQPSASQRHRNSTIISIGTDQVLSPNSSSGDAAKLLNSDGKDHHKDKKLHKRGFSFGVKLGGSSHDRWSRNHSSAISEKEKRENTAARLLGTPVCPRLDDVTIIEPLVCKKIAHERLTGLEFREDCIVTVCQEGFIVTWARPGKAVLHRRNINSPVSISSQKVPGATVV